MTTHIGIGFSKNVNTAIAAEEAAAQARTQLNQNRIDLAILLNTTHYNPDEFLPLIYKTLDSTKIIGSSTAGIILSDRIEMRGIAVMTITSETIKFEESHEAHLNLQNMEEAGQKFVKNLLSGFGQPQRKLLFFFVDGFLNNISNFISGIKAHAGDTLPVLGAGSCDNFLFEKSYQYYQNQPLTYGATGILIGGHLTVGTSCKHGWRPLGKPRTINETDEQIIKTIDSQEAVKIYEEYFDSEADTLKVNRLNHINIRYPLGIFMDDKNEYLLRHTVTTREDGGIICQDKTIKNTEVHIMIGNKDSHLSAAHNAALEIEQTLAGKTPKFILVFTNLTRYKILGRDAFQEIQVIKDVLGKDVPLFGMYSYGEIFTFPYTTNPNKIQLQNGSINIIAIS